MSELGRLIRNRRMEIGKTLDEVGTLVGVSKTTVQRWESGMIKDMRRDKLVKLAAALNVAPAYLMGWNDPAQNEAPDTETNDPWSEVRAVFDKLSPDNRTKLLELAHLYLAAQSSNTEKK